jgi:hypothetical protein
MVNGTKVSASESSRDSEDSKGLLGDLWENDFGDSIYVKINNTLRIGFQNVGGFPTQPGKLKEDNIRRGIQKWDFDVFGMAEVNLDWRLLQDKERLPTRTQEWWELQNVSWANNRTFPPKQIRQYGGTALFTVDQVAHRVIEKGSDKTLLGRWTWTRFKGKSNHTLRIITAYRPNPPQGPYSVYAQQNALFHSIQRDVCPRQAFLTDINEEVNSFLEAGDHIILLINGNSSMKAGDLCMALQRVSLREVIIDRHGLQGPATHKRNSTGTPIDGIWMSPGLSIEKGGYFAYDEVIPSDHRCLWVDITFVSAFGHDMAPITKRKPKRLHCRDPRLVDNFIHLYHQFANPLKLFEQVQAFEKLAPFLSKNEIAQCYEELDAIRCEATTFAENVAENYV